MWCTFSCVAKKKCNLISPNFFLLWKYNARNEMTDKFWGGGGGSLFVVWFIGVIEGYLFVIFLGKFLMKINRKIHGKANAKNRLPRGNQSSSRQQQRNISQLECKKPSRKTLRKVHFHHKYHIPSSQQIVRKPHTIS